jgi:hypothetical protein
MDTRSTCTRRAGLSFRENILRGGFTRRELVVVAATLGVFGLIAIQAHSRSGARVKGRQAIQSVYCLDNARQLATALHLYATDHDGWLPPNSDDDKAPANWVRGNMRNESDATNTLYLTDPKFARLAPYSGFSASIYKCPADTSEVDIDGILYPRVRTFSMSQAVGTKPVAPLASVDGPWLDGTRHHTANKPWRTYGRMSDMVKPTPANLWVFLDEDQDSINDGAFAVSMARPTAWVDWPGSYHNYSASIAFGDGHSESHKWSDKRSKLSGGYSAANEDATRSQPDNPDIIWLQNRTSASVLDNQNMGTAQK